MTSMDAITVAEKGNQWRAMVAKVAALESENAALWTFVRAQDTVDERVKSWHGGDGSEPYEDWPGPLEQRDFAREALRQYEIEGDQ